MADFVHLHTHSEYSLLDGLPKIKELVAMAKELGMPAVALTDHGAMYGAVEFYKECKAEGIKGIIGMEGYTVIGDHRKKEGREDKSTHHILLLAKNLTGYKNLMQITTVAHLEGYYYRPRVSLSVLRQYSEGLICTSACPKGEIPSLLIDDDFDQAAKRVAWYQETFGPESYYLEIQRHQYKDYIEAAGDSEKLKSRLAAMQEAEDKWLSGIVRLSAQMAVPMVATNDAHYLRQKDHSSQDVLVCIYTGKVLTDVDRLRYVDSPTFFLRSGEEMEEIFPEYPEAIANTGRIAKQCEVELELGKWFFPHFDIPAEKTAEGYLKEQVLSGLARRYLHVTPVLSERLEYELGVIIGKGYGPYFLMMADLVNWCTSAGIITNTRGSAAGSLVSYCLGITNIDPIKYELPFERFLNPLRPKPPDIDLDVADNRREEVLSYIVKKYGEDRVAQICTFGRMLARAAVRDVGRVLGYPYSVPDKIAKVVPLGSQGFPMTINHALSVSAELKAMYEMDADVKKIVDLAKEIEGNARHASIHAAGVVVSPTKMTDYTPLQREPNGEKIITQYEMHACEEVGLVKFDILGIRNLAILGAAVDVVEVERKIKIDLDDIPLDDAKTFKLLSSGATMGVFQLGGAGMTRWLKELRPNRLEDIMVMITLFRPGPMANIPEYIARKHGESATTFFHPKMKKILEKSYGILVYQEDVLLTALELAGYDWASVDALRQAIGKKKPKEMAQQAEKFIKGCMKHSAMSSLDAEAVWQLFVPFQGYGFNKAHAASYGIVSYQTAYLKAHYPVEYMTALLTAESGDIDKVAEAVAECRRMKIAVLRPDINFSGVGFVVERDESSLDGRAIRFGLSAIKNVGTAAIGAILLTRESRGPFAGLSDFARRVDLQKVNRKTLESLVKAGALDSFGKRAAMLSAIDRVISESQKFAKQVRSGQTGLFEDGFRDEGYALADVPELAAEQLLTFEREYLGFYLSEHPAAEKLSQVAEMVTHEISALDPTYHLNKVVTIGGLVASVRRVFTRKNNEEMAFVTVEGRDGGKVECVVFPKVYNQNGGKNYCQPNRVVVLSGRVDNRDDRVCLIVESIKALD